MAEPVIFGGSPLDRYLQDADQSETQAFLGDLDHNSALSQPSTPGLGLHLASTPPRSPSISMTRRSHDLESPDASKSQDSTFRRLATTASPDSSRGRGSGTSRVAPSNIIADREARDNLQSLTRQEPVSRSSQEQPSRTDPASQLASAIRALVRSVLLPLVFMFAHNVLGWRPTNAASDRVGADTSRSTRLATATEALDDDESSSSSFVERFKYVICSSFLLTPGLSISFYGSSPPVQTQHPSNDRSTGGKRISSHVQGRRASPTSIRKQCYVEPGDAPARDAQVAIADTHDRLPRLDAQGRTARNAALLSAVFLIPPISPSWRLWLSTLLLTACLIWGFIVLLGHSSLDDKIEFTLSRQPDIRATMSANSLHNLSTTNDLSRSEKEALQKAVVQDVSSLIKAAQSFDVSINKAISAIQEVEVVSRGYKLTHPLPPISRIEAASGSFTVASPNARRRSIAAVTGSANGKLGRSLSSGGNGAPTVRRHGQRPLSLTLSNGRISPLDRPSGRASPAVSSEVGDVDHVQKLLAEQSTAALAASRAAPHRAPQRLVELRKTLVGALEGVGATFTSSNASLQVLADAEELALLHDLYALDASPQDDADEADVSHAWSHGDTSAISESSPDLELDRRPWVATTPRNFGSNVRAAELAGYGDLAWRSDLSPQTGSLNHKRLSLVSDAGSVLDRHPRASSSLSRRSSLVSESGKAGQYRSPRLNYVSEQATGVSGPNESAAAKRLSYVSNSNSSFATGSFDTRSPVMRNSSAVSSTFTPPHSSAQTYSTATSPQSRATKRSSILGPNSIFAQLDPPLSAASSTKPADPLSLMSIKAKFEWMHRARRRWLCHLLALDLKMRGCVSLSTGDSLPCDEYWTAARSTIESASSTLRAQNKAVTEVVEKEMGLDFLRTSRAQAPVGQGAQGQDARSESRDGRLTIPGAGGDASTFSVVGHPGIEDRLHAMMLTLRSLQSKIRVCAEDIRVKAPAGLHGVEGGQSEQAVSPTAEANDDAAIALQLERTVESMRDDLLGLSAEWEATVKLIRKEKRRSPSPQPSTDLEADVSMSKAARELESPLEADEDAAHPSNSKDGGKQEFHDDLLPLSRRQGQEGYRNDASDDEDDSDLAALLLNSTSPNSLPPPGLEQVFESIAGIAGLSVLAGSKLSRAERIEQTRLQRQQEHESRAQAKSSQRHSMDPIGMMSELNDVISTRRAVRDQRHQSALPLSMAANDACTAQKASTPLLEAQPALALGSPLDLGSAGREGVFGASHSFVDDQAMPRRSLSSLDLARARALQALEARSPSVASSSASNSFESGDESQSRQSDEFSFEPTPLESVPEDDAAAAAAATAVLTSTPNLPSESPLTAWDSGSRKSTPKASQVPLSSSDATPVPDSPFDLGAQVAAYARRKKAAKAQAAAMQASGSESSVSSSSSSHLSSNHESYGPF